MRRMVAFRPSTRPLDRPRRMAAWMPSLWARMVRASLTKAGRRERCAREHQRVSRWATSSLVRSPAKTARSASYRLSGPHGGGGGARGVADRPGWILGRWTGTRRGGGGMGVGVARTGEGHRLSGEDETAEAANAFLGHLAVRGYSPATVRAYAYDVANFATFLAERGLGLGEVVPSDLFGYLDWQQQHGRARSGKVVALARRGPAAATMNRRVSAVRGLFEYQVMAGALVDNPVPAGRRANGLRTPPRGLLGHVGPGRARGGGRLVRQADRLPESVDAEDVAAFLADLLTHRDRAIVLAMVLGGLRAGEVRSLRLADVDMGLGRVRVFGKGGRERIVPVDRAFFAECASYLREERPVDRHD